MKSGFRSMGISLLATGLAISTTTGTAFAKDPEPRSSDRTTASTGEFIELIVSLDEKQSYSLREFCRECNRKLNTSYAVDAVTERRIRISEQEQRLLRLLTRSGLGGEDFQMDFHAGWHMKCHSTRSDSYAPDLHRSILWNFSRR